MTQVLPIDYLYQPLGFINEFCKCVLLTAHFLGA